ncbi:type II toxin-antitoxin system RelB family antitoxin [Pseudomonas syringae]|uniref:type II toxin-antitoxin system RelB family antitoxin n=1 Tax=Pseudomonas syringae TaxID=317 RepID=UPI003F875CE3
MNTRTSQIVSEFETEEQASSYDKWFCVHVQTSIDDPAPNVPHDQVMAEMRAFLESKQTPPDAG